MLCIGSRRGAVHYFWKFQILSLFEKSRLNWLETIFVMFIVVNSRYITRDFLIIAFLWSNWREVTFCWAEICAYFLHVHILRIYIFTVLTHHFVVYCSYTSIKQNCISSSQMWWGKNVLSCSTKLIVSLFNLEGEGYILIRIFSAIKLVLIAQLLII